MSGASDDRLRLLAVCHYPSDRRPVDQVFVRATLRELTRLGVEVTVVAPESLLNLAKPAAGFRLAPLFQRRDGIAVYRPRYLSFAGLGLPTGGNTQRWTVHAHSAAAARQVRSLPWRVDLAFGHFLYPHGSSAATIGDRLGIPSVLSLGESSFRRYQSAFGDQDMRSLFARFAGVVANSEQLKERALGYGVPAAKVQVLPNGVNEELFHPRDREAARRQCGLPLDRPIIAFLGQFIERKGPLRVMEAIRARPDIGAVFLGHGPQAPSGPQVLFRGTVPHEHVPAWLSAADVLVLPTMDEGCSNAVLEALSCGLPVVSSDRPFNRAIIDEQVAVLVEPTDAAALRRAVVGLVDEPDRRAVLSRAALDRAQRFRLADRAQRMKAYLSSIVTTESERSGRVASGEQG
jgi:glycosyltransferase involved in cell wall biosynthesis